MGRLERATLLSNPELERAIADFPYDEERWSILEDWLLEQDDPRAILVRLEQAGRHDAASRVRVRLHPQLLGPDHESIAPMLVRANWRAGYLREVRYAGDVANLVTLSKAPAARILRTLTLTGKLRTALATIAKSVIVEVLHDLTLSNTDNAALLVPASALVHFTRLRRLALRGVYIEGTAQVPRVTRLVIAPTSYDVEQLGPFVTNVEFPAVTELHLDLYTMAHPQLAAATLEALLGRFAPNVTHFEVRCATSEIARNVLRILAVSRLLTQLAVVNLGPVDGHEQVRQEYGDRFDRARVTLPAE